jgi:hypothetical protein
MEGEAGTCSLRGFELWLPDQQNVFDFYQPEATISDTTTIIRREAAGSPRGAANR